MRESVWKIVWGAGGGSPRTLLDYGDLLTSEIRTGWKSRTDVGKPDFSLAGIPVSRGNTAMRLEFSVRRPHASMVAAWREVLDQLASDPWGVRETMSIQGLDEVAVNHTAVLLTTSHYPFASDGVIESVHEYAFRVRRI